MRVRELVSRLVNFAAGLWATPGCLLEPSWRPLIASGWLLEVFWGRCERLLTASWGRQGGPKIKEHHRVSVFDDPPPGAPQIIQHQRISGFGGSSGRPTTQRLPTCFCVCGPPPMPLKSCSTACQATASEKRSLESSAREARAWILVYIYMCSSSTYCMYNTFLVIIAHHAGKLQEILTAMGSILGP